MASIRISSATGSRELAKLKGFAGAELCTLPHADVEFTGYKPFCGRQPVKVGIELKTWGDFASSTMDKRLTGFDGQIARMRTEYEICYLLIYGAVQFAKDDTLITQRHRYEGFTRQRMENTLRSIESAGVIVRREEKKTDAARWILETIAYYQDPNHHTFFSPQSRKSYDAARIQRILTKERVKLPPVIRRALRTSGGVRFVNFACQLPTVSVRKAVLLLEAFGSIEVLTLATEKEIAKVESFGPAGARLIVNALQEDAR